MLRSNTQFVNTREIRLAIRVASAALIAVLGWTPAYASEATAANGAGAGAAAPSDDFEEIVVTANRRPEKLQDVGAAVTLESSAKIEAFQVTRAEDLAKLSPGLAAIPENGSAVSSFSIRGLSQADSSEHEEQPVAIYQDGTYVAIPAATGFPIYDVDHAEVLRGPQGTLFGRNATGGSVQFFSNQPTDTFAAGISYTAGDYNLRRLEGFINGGNSVVSDRFAYYLSERGGYVKNLDGPNLLSSDVAAFRNQTKFKFGDNTEGTLRLETWQDNGTPANRQTASFTPAGSIYDRALPQTAPNLYGYVNPSTSPFVQAVNVPGEVFKRASTIALNVEHKMGDITLDSVTSFIRTRINYLEDTDGTPDNNAYYSDGGVADTYGQEFRLIKSNGAFRWTTGVNFFENKGDFFVLFAQPTFCDPTSTTVCATAGQGSAHFPLSSALGKGAQLQTAYSLDYKAYSGFGQTEYDITDKLTAIVGARYTYDDQHFDWSFNCTQSIASGCLTVFGTPAGTGGNFNYAPVTNLSQTKGLWSGKAQLNYKLDPDVLLYALLSKGVKSGGYFDATAGNVPASQFSFKAETLYATEAGIKSQFLDRKLTVNADYYHYNYENSQQFNFVNGIYFTVVNLPANSNGFELETNYKLGHGFSVNFSGSYNDIWVHDVQPCSTCAPQNERPIDAPKYIGAAGFEEDFKFRDLAFSLMYNARYTGDRYFALINQPVAHAPAYIVQDASFRVSTESGLWVQAWVSNLANRVYANSQFDNTAQGFALTHIAPPRMGGVTVGIRF